MTKKNNPDISPGKNEVIEKAKQLFDEQPALDVLFGTADGTMFYTRTHAGNHAQSLENKEVETINRQK